MLQTSLAHQQPKGYEEFPLKKNLQKRVTILVLSFFTLTLTANVATYLYPNYSPVLFPIVSIVALGSIFIIWNSFKPLEELYTGVKVLASGELKHRFNIHTGDEVEAIAQILNTMAKNLDNGLKEASQDKNFVFSERNKLEAIISSIVDGVIVLGLHQNVIMANKAAEKITGYQSEEMVGHQIDGLIIIKDQSNNIVSSKEYCQKEDMDSSPIPNVLKGVHILSKNGKEFQADLTVSPINEGIRGDLSYIILLHDTSQNKQLEQMQIDFVSMASHEIRTPLTSIINYLSTIQEENKLKSETKEFLNRALTSAQQLSVLVDNLLNVSKIERGSFALSLHPLDWKKILTRAVENNTGQAVDKHINLHLKLPEGPLPKVLADEIRINEVLNNLINNAVIHNKEDGDVEVGTKTEGDQVVTYVRDNGLGIPKDAIPHLFTKFFRVKGSLEQMKEGSGLGLYMSKSIVNLHHGKIWLDSKEGEGSTFYFSLPTENSIKSQPTIAQLGSEKTSS
ncbi:MAG: ATP-binding protein [Patescibacteria group bacterium]|nr:ATP-binding protein [Patescibacteria group bacterium]